MFKIRAMLESPGKFWKFLSRKPLILKYYLHIPKNHWHSERELQMEGSTTPKQQNGWELLILASSYTTPLSPTASDYVCMHTCVWGELCVGGCMHVCLMKWCSVLKKTLELIDGINYWCILTHICAHTLLCPSFPDIHPCRTYKVHVRGNLSLC